MTKYATAKVKIEGVSPLALHNVRLANPFDPLVKEIKQITSRRKKSDEDLEQLMLLEWKGGWYTNEKRQPVLPGINIEAALREAAKSRKLGKAFKSAVFVEGVFPIEYDGPKTIDELEGDPRFIWSGMMKVSTSKVLRCMPQIPVWSLAFEIRFQVDVIDPGVMKQVLEHCGENVAIGALRPRYGRFKITDFKVK